MAHLWHIIISHVVSFMSSNDKIHKHLMLKHPKSHIFDNNNINVHIYVCVQNDKNVTTECFVPIRATTNFPLVGFLCYQNEYTRVYRVYIKLSSSLHWRHNDHDGVSNHQPHDFLHNRLFRRRSKKTSKLCVTGLCVGNSPGPIISPHKGPVTRKMFPFDDVIMLYLTDVPTVRL